VSAALTPVLAACREHPRDRAARPAPNEAARQRAAAAQAEQRAVDAYDAALAGAPALTRELTPLREHHRTHVTTLIGGALESPSPSPTAVSSRAASAQIRTSLAGVELALRDQHLAALDAAAPDLALLLASLAAAAAAHHAVLVAP
jgi:hypothetical protein